MDDSFIKNGISRLLLESQIHLGELESAVYSRTARRVLTRAGAEQAAHFVVEFNPEHERLDICHIRVVRGQEHIEHARLDSIQVFQRENNLEHSILDGRLTASLLIPDVRVDDVVDVGFTIHSHNKVVSGRNAGWLAFDAINPWHEMRHRLLRPLARNLTFRSFNDPPQRSVTVRDGIEESRWHLVGQQKRNDEELTPPWFIPIPVLQYSDCGSWNDIARLFSPFYDDSPLPDALAAEIDQLAATYRDSAERAAEWLRFVQRELRYFALSLGQGGLVPRRLDAIWLSRFGDCKDAAQLYIAGARRMGLEACAALCSTTYGPALNDLLPGHNLFNHCIVRLRLAGRSYWLDPTSQIQSGSLDNIDQPHYGWALALTPDTSALERLGSDEPVHFLDLKESVRFGPKKDSPATLRREMTYSSWAADSVRNRIANEGASAFAEEMLREMRANWPDTVETTPVEISDDQVKNRFVAILNYEIRQCWKNDPTGRILIFEASDYHVAGQLAALTELHRQSDIVLGQPRKVTRRMYMEMPRKWLGKKLHDGALAAGISHCSERIVAGRTVLTSKEVVIDAWSIPGDQAGEYSRAVQNLHKNMPQVLAWERSGVVAPIPGFDWRTLVWTLTGF